jgi:hypothetical protein
MMTFVQSFLFWFFGVYVVLSLIGFLIPAVRRGGWSTLVIFPMALVIGYLQGVSAVTVQAHAWAKTVKESMPLSENAARSLVGDTLPQLKKLHGKITPDMLDAAKRVSEEGSPCSSAMAKSVLGETVDVDAACQ